MIFIFSALIYEAKPIIDTYNLKKISSDLMYNIYMDEAESIMLTISGVGQINMACAVAHVLTAYQAKRNDFIINIGTCAGMQKGLFMVNKIIEDTTGRTFYPDILYKHSLRENTLLSSVKVAEDNYGKTEYLFDMEGAAFYQSAIKYADVDRIVLLKSVSDSFKGNEVSKEQVTKAIQDNLEELKILIDEYRCVLAESKKDAPYIKNNLNKLEEDLHLSQTLRLQLRNFINYLTLSNIDYEKEIEDLYKSERIPCKDKKEGKLILDELQKRLLY